MRWRKAETETGEFAAVKEDIHYLLGEGKNWEKKRPGGWRGGWTNWQVGEERKGKQSYSWSEIIVGIPTLKS